MEVIILDEGFYPILLHEPVIFFRTVTRSLPHRYSVNGYSGTGKSEKSMRVSVSVGWETDESVMDGFQYYLQNYIRFGLPFFMAS
ncbi:hypothetical protein BACOVA_01337, partial [Bacteroides ovatus ATCC 8483]